MNRSVLEVQLESYFKRTFPLCVDCDRKGCEICAHRPRPKNDPQTKHPEYTGAI